jgi:aspartyl-tRNA(Asn)/glutamyl-tRNA(Gln) amidotransferase subunit A
MRFHVAETIVLGGCDEPVREAFEAALRELSKAGAIITRGPVREFEECAAIAPNLYPFEAWRQWGEAIEARGDIMYEPVRRRFMLGRNVTADEHTRAASRMQALRQSWADSTNGVDAVLMPTVPILPPPVEALLADGDHFTERNLMALRNTRFANTLGLCALTVPLPQPACGLMLYGKPFGEARLLAIGAAVEKAVKG